MKNWKEVFVIASVVIILAILIVASTMPKDFGEWDRAEIQLDGYLYTMEVDSVKLSPFGIITISGRDLWSDEDEVISTSIKNVILYRREEK